MFTSNWLWKSFIATLCNVPLLIIIGFFVRNYRLKPEVIMIWYVLGMLLGASVGMLCLNRISGEDFIPTGSLIMIAMMGLVFGTSTNILLYQAIAEAPNPGLPMACFNTSSLIAFIIAPLLAFALPRYFDRTIFNMYHFTGILLTIVGVCLIALKR